MPRDDWRQEYLQMIEDCEARESSLTEWEVNFLENVRFQLEDDRTLSDRQTEVLDNIWERVTK